MDIDLSVIPTKELVDELVGRFDHSVFCGMQVGGAGPKDSVFRRRWKGNTHTCVGLTEDMKVTMLRHFHDEQKPFQDDGDEG